MILGALFAHVSGKALWLKKPGMPPQNEPRPAAVSKVNAASLSTPAPSLPKGVPMPDDALLTPPEEKPAPVPGMSLSLPPGASGLREQLSGEPPK
jgi:hypothetical protein